MIHFIHKIRCGTHAGNTFVIKFERLLLRVVQSSSIFSGFLAKTPSTFSCIRPLNSTGEKLDVIHTHLFLMELSRA